MTKQIPFVIFILSIFVGSSFAVPAGFNVQGRLTDDKGINRDGNYPITFSIFNVETGGTALWEQNLSVTVKNGNFQVILQGLDKNNKAIEETVKNLDTAYYIEITVSGEAPMVPRQLLLRSPFAVADKLTSKSDVVIQSDNQNMGAGSIFIKTGTKDSVTILNNGNVGIGTTNPTHKLHLKDEGAWLYIEGGWPNINFHETDQTGEGAYWRQVVDARHIRWDSSDNPAIAPYNVRFLINYDGNIQASSNQHDSCGWFFGNWRQDGCDHVDYIPHTYCPSGKYAAGIHISATKCGAGYCCRWELYCCGL